MMGSLQEVRYEIIPRRKKYPLNARRLLWKVITSAIAHGSMPCWGLPFEAIAASLLLKDRSHRVSRRSDSDQ
jgi:hypothetical protein